MHNLVTHRDAGPAHTLAIEMAVHTAEDIADMGELGLKRRGTTSSADKLRYVEEDADGRANGVDMADIKAAEPQPARNAPPLYRRASTLTSTGSQKIFADHEAKTRKRARELKRSKYLLDPRTSKLMPNWDVVTSIALIFTAIMTPVEVGFMDIPADRWADGLFITNRCVDIIFILDVLMQFFIMYPETDIKSPEGEHWVMDRRKIAWRYVTGVWFVVDVLSIGVSLFDILAPTSGPLARFKGFRAIRALRLIKLIRLVNASRIFKRWELKASINYAVLSISVILLGLIFLCHLFACVWGLQASFDPLNSWLGPQQQGYCVEWDPTTPCPDGQRCDENGYSCLQPVTLYIRAFYFAVTTVTSTGYGDVAASKLNATENLVCAAILYIGAVCFAYIVGSFFGIVVSLAPERAQFRTDLTELNFHMAAENIPPEMQYRLREYMHLTVHLRQGATRVRLLQLLSPGLAGDFALRMNERWLKNVWWLEGIDVKQDRELHIMLCLELRAQVFPHKEPVPLGSLYVVSGRGRALYAGRVLALGNAFRTDEILEAAGLRAGFPVIALSYLMTYSILGERLREIIRECPIHIRQVINKHQRNLTMHRTMVRAAEEECARHGVPFYGRPQYIYARVGRSLAADFMISDPSASIIGAALDVCVEREIARERHASQEPCALLQLVVSRVTQARKGTGAIVGAHAASKGSASERMQQLRQLLDAGFISQEEFDRKRKQILDGKPPSRPASFVLQGDRSRALAAAPATPLESQGPHRC